MAARLLRLCAPMLVAAGATAAAASPSLALVGPPHIRCAGPGSSSDRGDAAGSGRVGNDGDHDGDDFPPCPVAGKTVLIARLAGVVDVSRPHGGAFALKAPTSVPVGSVIDARRGHFRLTADERRVGIRFATSDFYGGRARVAQDSGAGHATVTMQLVGSSCTTGGQRSKARSSRSRSSHHATAHLWGNGKGHFSTSGHYAAAIVQGTRWLVTDFCDGSDVTVRRGLVAVHDRVTGQNVAVPAGEHVFAKLQPKPKLLGDAKQVSGEQVRMTSTGTGTALVSVPLGDRTFSSLQQLSLAFLVQQGTCTVGSPRIQIHLLAPGADNNPQDGLTLFAYLGPGASHITAPTSCPTTGGFYSQPNLIAPNDPQPRWEVSQSQPGPLTYSSVLAQFADYRMVDIQVAVDAGDLQQNNVQQVLMSSLLINNWSFFAPLVPTQG